MVVSRALLLLLGLSLVLSARHYWVVNGTSYIDVDGSSLQQWDYTSSSYVPTGRSYVTPGAGTAAPPFAYYNTSSGNFEITTAYTSADGLYQYNGTVYLDGTDIHFNSSYPSDSAALWSLNGDLLIVFPDSEAKSIGESWRYRPKNPTENRWEKLPPFPAVKLPRTAFVDSNGRAWALSVNDTHSFLRLFDGYVWKIVKLDPVVYQTAWSDNYGNIWLSPETGRSVISYPQSQSPDLSRFVGSFTVPSCGSSFSPSDIMNNTNSIYDPTGSTPNITITPNPIVFNSDYTVQATSSAGVLSRSTFRVTSVGSGPTLVYTGPAVVTLPDDIDFKFIYNYINYTCDQQSPHSMISSLTPLSPSTGGPSVTRGNNKKSTLPFGEVLHLSLNSTVPSYLQSNECTLAVSGTNQTIGSKLPLLQLGTYTVEYTSVDTSTTFVLVVENSISPYSMLEFNSYPSRPIDLMEDDIALLASLNDESSDDICGYDYRLCEYEWSSPNITNSEMEDLSLTGSDGEVLAFSSKTLSDDQFGGVYQFDVLVTVYNFTSDDEVVELFTKKGTFIFSKLYNRPKTNLSCDVSNDNIRGVMSTRNTLAIQTTFGFYPDDLEGDNIFITSVGSSTTSTFLLPTNGQYTTIALLTYSDGSTQLLNSRSCTPTSSKPDVVESIANAQKHLAQGANHLGMQYLYLAISGSVSGDNNLDPLYTELKKLGESIDFLADDDIQGSYANNYLVLINLYTSVYVDIDNFRLEALLEVALVDREIDPETGKIVFDVVSNIIKLTKPEETVRFAEYYNKTNAIFNPLTSVLRKVAEDSTSQKQGGTQYNATMISAVTGRYDTKSLKGRTISNGMTGSQSAIFILPNSTSLYGNNTKATAVVYTLKFNPFFAYLPDEIRYAETLLSNVAGLSFYGENGTEIPVRPENTLDTTALFTIRIPVSEKMIAASNGTGMIFKCLYWNSTSNMIGNDGMFPDRPSVLVNGYVNCTTNHLTNFTVALIPGIPGKKDITLYIALPIAAAALVGIVLGGSVFYVRRKSNQFKKRRELDEELMKRNAAASVFAPIKPDAIQVLMRIGGGAFGDVYKGQYLGTTEVALKKLSENAGQDVQEEFQQEAAMLQKLLHPNVTQFLGIWINTDGEQYMVSEFMAKGSLLSVLRDPNERPTIDDVLIMCQGTVAGMNYLADRNIVHRDLAARNLLVKSEGRRYVVKVADFGMSRETENQEHYESKSNKFPVKWSAPEILQHRKYSTKSDVWAFGIVMWEIFEYGKIPYPDMNNAEASQRVMEGYRLPPPRECPPEVYDIMLQCWHHNAEDRPNFKELFHKLSDLLLNRGALDERILAAQDLPVEEPAPNQLYNNNDNLYSIDDKARASASISAQQIYNSKNVAEIGLQSANKAETDDIYAFSDKSVQRASNNYTVPPSIAYTSPSGAYSSPSDDIYSFSDATVQRASGQVTDTEDIYSFSDDAKRNSTQIVPGQISNYPRGNNNNSTKQEDIYNSEDYATQD